MAERYLPLYRKYRPQTFKDLIGQENIVKALTNAINLNKISHAYLLCGPRGTGKTTTARIIAKSLNCANGPTLEPCGECPSCKDITNSTPIDVIEIDAASNRKVEDARNILEKIQFVPVNGHFKIYIIDEVHMLTTEAFNTLLKTLEEPPENVIFILATTEPHKVLDTIISRCQRFDFRRITTEDIVARLEYICEQEKINITKDALFTIARSSQGGMRDSLALLDQISVLDADKEITSDDVNEMLGRLSFETLFELSGNILNSNSQNAIELLNSVYNKGNEPFQIISNLIQYFRNLLVVKNCTDRNIAIELTQLSEAHVLKLKEQGENVEPEQVIYTVERLSYYSKEIKETTNRYLWLELCIIELASNIKYTSYAQLIERLERLESGASVSSSAPVHPAKAPSFTFTAPQAYQAPKLEIRKPEPLKIEQPKVEPPKAETVNPEPPKVEAVKIEPAPAEPVQPAPSIAQPAAAVEPEPVVEQQQAGQPVVSKPEPVQQSAPAAQASGTADLATAWQGILQNIESMPSRMFFYNLSRPVSLTPQGIEIVFGKDVFVKQAKEDSKNAPLKKAAMNYFGVNEINIHIRLADGNEMQQAPKPSMPKAESKPAPIQDDRAQVENQNAEALKAELASSATAPSGESANTGVPAQSSAPQAKNPVPENLSDQSKMVMELFNGKYIE